MHYDLVELFLNIPFRDPIAAAISMIEMHLHPDRVESIIKIANKSLNIYLLLEH